MKFQVTHEKYSVIHQHELWENQRDPDKNLVNEIVKFQLDFYKDVGEFIFPSTLVFAKFSKNYYLIDGQHRREALKILYDYHNHDIVISCIFYDCKDKKSVDRLYTIANRSNTNNCMLTQHGDLDEDGPKLKEIHKLLKEKYGDEVWHDKKIAKPYVNLKLLDTEFKKYGFFKSKSVGEIIKAVVQKNHVYKKTLSKTDLVEVENFGGFCLQYKKPKARWVEELFD
jgi:hypothetical protein